MEPAIVMLAVVGLPLLLFAVWLIVNFNRFVRCRTHMRESWADIDVELKRRYDLIPNLVEVVKGYAKHEREVLAQIAELRSRAMAPHASATDRSVDETALAIGLERVMAVVENYPDLKADTHFLALQRELANTEDRLAASRRFYNANVRELNELAQSFPTNLIAGAFGFEQADYFEAHSAKVRTAPDVAMN
ncbi:LemA family protein [Botrimarina sp.]|uniref:LemA family protein n=1 Tax=Botrimarina sp. TaxID=2795802 RepID=UPI0032EAEADB